MYMQHAAMGIPAAGPAGGMEEKRKKKTEDVDPAELIPQVHSSLYACLDLADPSSANYNYVYVAPHRSQSCSEKSRSPSCLTSSIHN